MKTFKTYHKIRHLSLPLRHCLIVSVFVLALSIFFPPQLHATPEYSSRTGEGCKTCHIEPMGGKLSVTGLEFAASGYTWPPEGGFRVVSPIRKPIRFIMGFMHIVAAFIWFGTILYVHLLLKPAYAEKGLPKGEVAMGLVSMAVVGLTGALLTLSRIRGMDVLINSDWGVVLSFKIALYLFMILSALFVITFIGPKLRSRKIEAVLPEDGVFDPATLSAFDGKDGRPAFVAYDSKVYDMSALKLWKNGDHMKHHAGVDLTSQLSKAPHGFEKLEPLKVMGSFDPSLPAPKTFHQKAFHVVAYLNLGLVFVVLMTIAYWRWGI